MSKHTLTSRHLLRTASALALAAVLATAATTGAAPAASAASRTGESTAAQLARLALADVNAGAPGVIVRVDDGSGQVVRIARQSPWSRDDHTLTAADRFRMGSNTKTMVATVVLQLVAEHRVRLTDPVARWLPGLVPGGQAITVRMLLDHTSGLFNYVNDPDVLKAFTGQDTRTWTPRQLVAAAVRHDPLFAPGTRYSYSNTNYILLGMLVEKASGRSLADLVQERIARPLHLKDTYLTTGSWQPGSSHLAHGYEPDAAHLAPLLPPGTPAGTAFAGPERAGGHVDTTWINPSTEWAAGGIVSSADDWARFDSALLSGRLLPPAQLKEMLTTVAEEPGNPNRYGLGIEQVVTPCGTVWGHDGQVPGYSSVDYTDATGRRTASVYTSTIFGLALPRTAAANQALVDAAVCAMLDKPAPPTLPAP
ncbi:MULTISPECIES: serine hydrolase [Streptacidiphilus]|uniref:Serine hydrolase domain-containing protein n=1 Tax=Streptacidiphilus cavernicola TaxID=3342716 RepID=A0ABV6UPZ9_9ACTN|nr:serine hydrolase domain-containing protein [Streptacidiphilus jeojiense]